MGTVATTGWDAQGNAISPQPAAPAAPQGWDAQGNPISTPKTAPGAIAAPPKPQPARDLITARFGPEGGEGSYAMHDFAGLPHQVGYSKVHQALDNGFLFSDKPTLEKYARDHAADPLDESRVDQWIDKHPIVSGPLQLLTGGYRGIIRTGTAFDRTPTTRAETEAQLFAASPNRTAGESVGGAAEQVGEFFTGEQLLGMLGRTGMVMSAAEKLKTVTGLAQLIEKVPMVGKLLKIGESAAKQGTTSAAQTYIQTRGDTGAAGTAGAMSAVAGPVAELVPATGAAVRDIAKGPGEKAAAEAEAIAAQRTAAAREAYAGHAREAIRPQLEETNAARNVPQQEVMMNQPGGQPAAPTGRMVATATGKPAPAQINIDHVLSQTHDFTGAADRLTAINDDAYNQFDTATNGRFRQLNGEVTAAQNAMRKGETGAAQIYKQKLAEMDQLMDSTQGEMTPEMKAAAKSGFRQSYVLRDFGNLWDRNLNGVPGSSQASQAQRGINGKGLLNDLQRAVKLYGRPQVEEALGQGRLDSLEEIANSNMTAAKRVTFNRGIWEVVKHLHHGAVLGGMTGELAGGHWAGGAAAGTTAAAAVDVINALKTNPKIAQNFMFALQSGARAEKYGPFIASMIQQATTDSSRQRQQQEQEQR